jgi:hypothetical protein
MSRLGTITEDLVTASRDKVMALLLKQPWREIEPLLAYDPITKFQVNIARGNSLSKTRRVTFIVSDDAIQAVCLSSRLRRSGDFEDLIQLEEVSQLEQATEWDSAVGAVPNGKQPNLAWALQSSAPISPSAFDELLKVLRPANPGLEGEIDRLRALTRQSLSEVTPAMARALEQRDSIALGLEMTGIDSRIALRGANVTEVPFLRGLVGATTSEASTIRNDAEAFPDWLPEETGQFDVWRYADPNDSHRKVTVLYADKEHLERVTGTDLIYFREEMPGFVLVQYKRMARETSDDIYRPDAQLEEEIRRMRAMGLGQQSAGSLDEWRLSTEPFYIKLVEPDVTRPAGNHLAKGMYFPVSLFELLVKEPSSLGPKGGVGIGRHNARRYLSNGEFVSLMQQSWIGTSGNATQQVSELIRSSLENQKGVVVVADQTDTVMAQPIRRR